MTPPSKPSNSPLAAKFGEIDGGTVLKKYHLVRELFLQENLTIEVKQCSICDFNREILYYGYYVDKNECFDVCELCGKDLIRISSAAVNSSASQTGRIQAVVADEQYPLLSWSDTGCGFAVELPSWFDEAEAAQVYNNHKFRAYIEKKANELVRLFYGSKASLQIQWNKNTGLQNVGFGGGNCTCTGIESSTLLERRATPICTHNIDSIQQATILREVWMTYIGILNTTRQSKILKESTTLAAEPGKGEATD